MSGAPHCPTRCLPAWAVRYRTLLEDCLLGNGQSTPSQDSVPACRFLGNTAHVTPRLFLAPRSALRYIALLARESALIRKGPRQIYVLALRTHYRIGPKQEVSRTTLHTPDRLS